MGGYEEKLPWAPFARHHPCLFPCCYPKRLCYWNCAWSCQCNGQLQVSASSGDLVKRFSH